MLAIGLLFGFAGCKAQSDAFNVGTLKGPSGIGMIKMISDNATDNKIGIKRFLKRPPCNRIDIFAP